MTKFKYYLIAFSLVPSILLAEADGINWPEATIKYITARDGGFHAVFLNSTSLVENPDGCTFTNRAILPDTNGENKALYATLVSAMLSGAIVELRSFGCSITQIGSDNTAPTITKVKIFAP